MSSKLNTAIAVAGIDIGKNSFHVIGLDKRGAIVLRQKWSRGQVEARLANTPPSLIGMEACVGAHHLSRKLQALGHDARLTGAKADIDGRPYHPRQDIQARQSLSALSVRAGSLSRIGQGRAKALGPLWAQVLDRGCQKTSAPQCAGDRARQQACPHRLGGSQQGAQIRVHQDKQDVAPSCLSVAPCSDPSRRGLARLEARGKANATASLDGPLRVARQHMRRPGRRNGLQARTKELHKDTA